MSAMWCVLVISSKRPTKSVVETPSVLLMIFMRPVPYRHGHGVQHKNTHVHHTHMRIDMENRINDTDRQSAEPRAHTCVFYFCVGVLSVDGGGHVVAVHAEIAVQAVLCTRTRTRTHTREY